MVSRLIDIIIILITSFFIAGVVSNFTNNDLIILFSFFGTIGIWVFALIWYSNNRKKDELAKEEKVTTVNTANTEKKEPIAPEIIIPKSIDKPSFDLASKYAGGYISEVKSYWSDSDCDYHYHYHENFLTLYQDGRAVACPLLLPDIDKPESIDVSGSWNVALNDSNILEIEILLKKNSTIKYDPYLDIDESDLKDIKYGGYFAEYKDFLCEGYYKGIIANDEINIHQQVFKKIND